MYRSNQLVERMGLMGFCVAVMCMMAQLTGLYLPILHDYAVLSILLSIILWFLMAVSNLSFLN